MKEKLQIGEKVLMFTIDEKSDKANDYLKCIVDKSYQEVTVKRINNVLSNEIVTVVDKDGNEYCGSYILDQKLGRIFFVRKDEYILLLRKAFLNSLSDYQYINWNKRVYPEATKIYKKINQECNHLFVKIQDGYWTGGMHTTDYEYSPSIVLCVHCGLTNRYHELVNSRKKRFNNDVYWDLKIMDDAFNDYLNNSPSSRYYQGDESFINLISSEEYAFHNPIDVYREAKKNNPNATNDELFEIMKQIDRKNKGLQKRK